MAFVVCVTYETDDATVQRWKSGRNAHHMQHRSGYGVEKFLTALVIAWLISEICIHLTGVQGRSTYFVGGALIVAVTLVGGFMSLMPV